MGIESLLRPQTVGDAILRSGSFIGTTDNIGTAADDTKLYLKVQTVQFNVGVKIQDTTGDGDTVAHFDHDNEIRGQVSLRGFMLADHHIGIENLTNSTDEPNPFAVSMKLGEGTGTRAYKFKMMVNNIVVDWNRVAGLVGVAITGQITDTFTGSGAIALDETT
jgi:hypothetical protein